MPATFQIIREARITTAPEVPAVPESGIADPYVCRILASSPEPDSHRTSMDKETTLVNMVKEGSEGALSCFDHNKTVPYGSTANAVMDEEGKVFMDYIIERGLTIVHSDAPYGKSEDLIRMIRNNHIKKASVGLYGGWYYCPIDKADMFERVNGKYQCIHYPGDKITQKIDGKDEIVEVIPKIKDAHLGELSAVWAGSNTDAAIVERAEWELEQGILTKKRALHINKLFNVGIDLNRAKPDEGDKSVAIEKEDLEQITSAVVEGITKALPDKSGSDQSGDDNGSGEDMPAWAKKEFDALNAELDKVRKESVDSEKQTVISEARADYLKVRGDKIDAATLKGWEDKMDKLTLAEAQEERDFLKDYVARIEKSDDDSEGDQNSSNRDTYDDAGHPNTLDNDLLGDNGEGDGDEIV